MNVFVEFLLTITSAIFSSIVAYLVLSRSTNSLYQRLESEITGGLSARWANRILVVLVSAFVVIFSVLALLRYLTFHTGYIGVNTSWDLAQYDQIIWNSLHGRLFENTFILDARTFLGKSFTPILIAFVPLYAIWATPMVLLLVQVAAVALSTFPIYWFARSQITRGLSLVLCTAFLLSPGVENIVLTEFHEIALAVPLLAFAVFFLLHRSYRALLVSLGLALMVKEEIAFIVIAFGLYILLIQREYKLGFALASFGFIWGVALLQFIIPYFRGQEYGGVFYYFGQGAIGGGGARYGYLGQSVPEILKTIFTRPDIVLAHVLIPDKIEYVLHLFVPLAFVSLFGIELAALALPTLGYSLLSNYGLQYSIRSYYFAPLVPFLFFAAAVGLRRAHDWLNHVSFIRADAITPALAVLVLVSSGVTYFYQSPGPFGGDFQAWRYEFSEHTALGSKLLALIPLNQTVIAQNEYLAHLSHEPNIYEVPLPDYRDVDYVFADTREGWYAVHAGHWAVLRQTGFFETLAEQDGYWVGKRIAPQQSFQIHFGDELTALGYAQPITNSLKGGSTLRPIIFWRGEKSPAEALNIRIEVVDRQGHVWAEQDGEPRDGALPTSGWERGKTVADQYSLRLPPTMPPGEYELRVKVHPAADENYLDAYAADRGALGKDPLLARLYIEKNTASFTASDLVKEQPLYELFVDMGEIRFLGYYPILDAVSRNRPMSLGLYWRARGKPRGDYRVTVQLRDISGRIAFEQSARPAADSYPTTRWSEGEVLLDWHDFDLPANLATGSYSITVQLRDASTNAMIGETPIASISIVN